MLLMFRCRLIPSCRRNHIRKQLRKKSGRGNFVFRWVSSQKWKSIRHSPIPGFWVALLITRFITRIFDLTPCYSQTQSIINFIITRAQTGVIYMANKSNFYDWLFVSYVEQHTFSIESVKIYKVPLYIINFWRTGCVDQKIWAYMEYRDSFSILSFEFRASSWIINILILQ